MSWTQDQIDRLRDRMTLAKRAGEWLSASEVRMVLGLIAFWRRMTVRGGFMGPAEGLIPTIGQVKGQGVRGVIVECGRLGCGNRRKLGFAGLGLGDEVVFIEITKHAGFRCTHCGSRKVQIVADYPNALGPASGEGTSPY